MSGRPDAMGLDGLRTDQAPPLSVPTAFYLAATLAMGACGVLLAWAGNAATALRWLPLSIAATHLGTLGYLGSIMLGSLFQMAPVVAGAPVPGARFAHGVLALWVTGVASLVAGFVTGRGPWLGAGAALVGVSLTTVLAALGVALARAPTRTPTVWGMRLAVAGLAAVAALGALLALARAGALALPTELAVTVDAHASLGALVWVGGLIGAVSWQVIPMFYLAEAPPQRLQVASLVAVGLSGAAMLTAVLLRGSFTALLVAAAPAAAVVLALHPAATARAIAGRKRKRADASVSFWLAGLACAPLTLALALGAALGTDARWAVALGWVATWGWAGLISHGMLCRIVPFLVWFHRFSALAGLAPVPSMRGLLPDARVRAALWTHLAAVALGLVAIASGKDLVARAAGMGLVATAAVLGANLVHVLRRRS